MKFLAPTTAALMLLLMSQALPAESTLGKGSLRVHPTNPRYFTDGTGKAIYLTGSHNWSNFKDVKLPLVFDNDAYLDMLEKHHHNFIRLWTWEQFKYTYGASEATPPPEGSFSHSDLFPWPRLGPGCALDGKPKFQLKQFDQKYFDQLRDRVVAAGKRGFYVSVMLFEGHGALFSQPPWCWQGHPFHVKNNVNGIDGDPDGDGRGLEFYTLRVPAITALQESYVRKVIDTVNDLDNVLYEIANETTTYSTEWQYHMIDFVHNYEKRKPKQHPVGISFIAFRECDPPFTNEMLFRSRAEWLSPYDACFLKLPGDDTCNGYGYDPPPADGSKVIISDTDHIFGIGGDRKWVWKSFTRGLNTAYMDPMGPAFAWEGESKVWDLEDARRAMGYTLRFAERMDLVPMVPRGDLASTKYCLANPAAEYLVYAPEGGEISLNLSATSGMLSVEWFNPVTGKSIAAGSAVGGAQSTFRAPFEGDAVLYLRK
ncbi:MAG: DUF6298 domain-containing protein [Acidobacteriota bacterium]